MASTKFYLDTRHKANVSPLKLSVRVNKNAILLSLGIKLTTSQWDEKAQKIINHPNKLYLNKFITSIKQVVDTAVLDLIKDGKLKDMSLAEIKSYLIDMAFGGDSGTKKGNKKLFAARFVKFIESKRGSTREIYAATYKKIQTFDSSFDKLRFEDITVDWLRRFDNYMEITSPSKNARNIHLRNIRAVFNDAIDDEVTAAYPFRRFKIRPVATAKRALTIDQLRGVFNAAAEEHAEKYLDMFKLIFFLVGINIIDLLNLKEIIDGRIEYYRRKTNRLYSIKVEPEALKIINKYRGKGYLLDILDRYSNYKDFAHRLNNNLKQIGNTEIGPHGKKNHNPICPHLTTYWARHTWATIAASLDIPKETIAAALGHGGNTVTDIYIDFDRTKVDDANRRVIDFVLYNKK